MADKTFGITVKKDENFSEWFTQVVSEQGANLADIRYGVQGHVVHMPWTMRIANKLYSIIEDEVENDDHEPILFPTVIPKANLMKEKEHAGFTPEVFWVTKAGDRKLEEPEALRPTGETAFYPMYSLWIRSHNDLPFKRYQSRITVFRNEMTTRPFLRGREFMFFETHDVFATHDEAMEQIAKDKAIMDRVITEKLKIPFVFFKRPKWDAFKGAEDSYCADSLLPNGRRNQISSTHDLGQRFAKAYGIKFKDKDMKEKFAHQTCFGPGIWRIIASIISLHGDDNGLVLPMKIAPVQVIIIPITFSKKKELSEKVMRKADELAKKLSNKYSVKVDKSNNTPGYKFNQAELMGIPIRLELGPKDLEKEQAVVVRRTSKDKVASSIKDIEKIISEQVELFEKDLLERTKKNYETNTRSAESLDDIKKIMDKHKGFVISPFCSIGKDGEHCADVLKAETKGANVCGVPFGSEEKPKSGMKCPVCGKEAKHMVWLAKSI